MPQSRIDSKNVSHLIDTTDTSREEPYRLVRVSRSSGKVLKVIEYFESLTEAEAFMKGYLGNA